MSYVPVGPVEADLAPCPFCGGMAVLENVICEAYVRCTDCRARIVHHHHDNDDRKAIAGVTRAWNKRAVPEREGGRNGD